MVQDRMGRSLTPAQAVRKGVNRVYNWIADYGLMLVRCAGYVPFHRWRRLVYRLAGAKIGKGSAIHMFATFFSLKNLTIGEDTVIGWWAFLDGRGPLTIGNHVNIASEVMIYNSQHDLDAEDFRDELKPVVIEDYVFIGPRAIIIPGVRIGKGAAVAAGAVVTKDVAPLTIVGGVPAKPIRRRNLKSLHYRIGRARWFQ